MTRLVAVEGPQRGTAFEIQGGASVGRSRECVVHLDGTHISRVHARFEPRAGGLAVIDADSRNGVYVNGRRVREQVLAKDDEIEIGEHVLVFDPSFDVELAPPAAGGKQTSTTEVRDSIVTPFADMTLDRLQTAIDASRKLVPVEEDKDLAAAALSHLVKSTRAWRGFVAVMSRHGRIKPLAREVRDEDNDFRVTHVLYNQVCRERRALIATDVAAAGKQAGKPISVLAAPLVAGDKCIGFVYVDAPAEGSPPAPCFTKADLQAAAAYCALAAPLVAAARRASRAKNSLKSVLKRLDDESPFVAGDGPMKELAGRIDELSQLDSAVLLLGEFGSGREYLARAIHRRGPRASHGFVTVQCAALASALEGALFSGHKSGGGLIEAPRGGTVFLREVGELPAPLQEKLEHVLEGRNDGDEDDPHSNVRIMASSSQDLAALVRDGKFRAGLLSRFGATLQVPPLRERKGDVFLLLAHFLKTFGGRPGGTVKDHVSSEALAALDAYGWPGNARELRNAVERMLISAGSKKLGLEHVPAEIKGGK